MGSKLCLRCWGPKCECGARSCAEPCAALSCSGAFARLRGNVKHSLWRFLLPQIPCRNQAGRRRHHQDKRRPRAGRHRCSTQLGACTAENAGGVTAATTTGWSYRVRLAECCRMRFNTARCGLSRAASRPKRWPSGTRPLGCCISKEPSFGLISGGKDSASGSQRG